MQQFFKIVEKVYNSRGKISENAKMREGRGSKDQYILITQFIWDKAIK